MSNTVFKIMAFMFFLNISVGIMNNSILDGNGNKLFDSDTVMGKSKMGGLYYNGTYSNSFTTGMEKDINANAQLTDKGNEIYRVLDMIGLGFIVRLLEFVKQYAFGFIGLLDGVFGRYMDVGLRSFLFGYDKAWQLGILYIATTIGYIFAVFEMFSNKNISQ